MRSRSSRLTRGLRSSASSRVRSRRPRSAATIRSPLPGRRPARRCASPAQWSAPSAAPASRASARCSCPRWPVPSWARRSAMPSSTTTPRLTRRPIRARVPTRATWQPRTRGETSAAETSAAGRLRRLAGSAHRLARSRCCSRACAARVKAFAGQAMCSCRAAAKRGMPASTMSSDAVRLMRNQPGTSTTLPGSTSTLWRASVSAKAASSGMGERAIV